MFYSYSFVGKMGVHHLCIYSSLRFAFLTVQPSSNGRYALEEFRWQMARVGGLSWTRFSEVGYEGNNEELNRNNANCSALPCSSTPRWVGNNVLPFTFQRNRDCCERRGNKTQQKLNERQLNVQKQLLFVYYKLFFLRLVLHSSSKWHFTEVQPENSLWRGCGLELVKVTAVIYESRILFFVVVKEN